MDGIGSHPFGSRTRLSPAGLASALFILQPHFLQRHATLRMTDSFTRAAWARSRQALAALSAINSSGSRAVLHGSMVELSIFSFTNSSATDLLNDGKPCYVSKEHHLQVGSGSCVSSSSELQSG